MCTNARGLPFGQRAKTTYAGRVIRLPQRTAGPVFARATFGQRGREKKNSKWSGKLADIPLGVHPL